MPAPSAEMAGIHNYTTKLNWRRKDAGEERLPGWDNFPGTSPDTEGEPILLLDEFTDPEGNHVAVAASTTRLYYYNAVSGRWVLIGSGFDAAAIYWEFVVIDNHGVFNNGIDLPVIWSVGEGTVTPIYELREAGIAAIGTIENYENFLVCGNVTEITEESLTDFFNDPSGKVVPGQDAYGKIIDTTMLLYYPWKFIWSDPGRAQRWKVSWYGSFDGSDEVTLEFPTRVLEVGDTIDMGGKISEAPITAIDATRTVLTIDTAYATPIARDLVVKADYQALLSGYDELLGDGGRIIKIRTLQEYTVICQEKGFRLALSSGDARDPFTITRVYSGKETLFFPEVIDVVNDEYIIYAGKKHFYTFDLINRRPVIHELLDLHRDTFFKKATRTNCISRVNQADGEVWISVSDGSDSFTLVWDYETKTVYKIDAAFTALGNCYKPDEAMIDESSDNWFILGDAAGKIYLFGQDESGEAIYNRCGEAYNSILETGLDYLDDLLSQKILHTYQIALSSHSSDTPIDVTILKASVPSDSPTEVYTKTFVSPKTKNLIGFHKGFDLLGLRVAVNGKDNPVILSHQVIEYTNTRRGKVSRLA